MLQFSGATHSASCSDNATSAAAETGRLRLRRQITALGQRLRRRDVAVYAVGLLVCLALAGFAAITPFDLLSFGGDTLWTLAIIKTYVDGFGFSSNPSLGYPGVLDNTFFPLFDFSHGLFLRGVAYFSQGIAAPYYLMYLAGVSAMFATSTVAFRSLGVRCWLAAFAAIVYVISPYFVYRSVNHDFLALYYSVPLGAAFALWLATEEAGFGKFLSVGGLLSLAIVSTSGLYYAFFSVLFMLVAATIGSAAQRSAKPLLIAAFSACIIFTLLVLVGFGTSIINVIRGVSPMVQRDASEQLLFGLSLAEATHVFNDVRPLQWVYQNYLTTRPFLSHVTGLTEWPGLMLTAVIFSSPLALAAIGSLQTPRPRWLNLAYAALACIVFGIIYSINGGLGYYFNMFVIPSIRATARVMPFLGFFALVIVLSIVESLIETGTIVARIGVVLFIVLLALCAYPNFNGFADKHRTLMDNPNLQKTMASTRSMLAAKDKANITAILQLPHVHWPEAGPIRNFEAYTHLRGYLLDKKGATTKWSYGSNANQRSFLSVNNIVSENREIGLPAAADRMGFDAILVEKSAYDDAELKSIKLNVESDARSCRVFDDEFRTLYSLKGGPCG